MRTIGRPLLAALMLLPLLAACSPAANDAVAVQDSAPIKGPQGGDPSPARQLRAITHRYTLRAPSADIEAIQQRHIAECARLGCSVLSTSIDRTNEGRINARATIRIKPEAFDAFVAVLAAPPVEVIVHAQSVDDIAVPIVDAERRLGAKIVVRDRLTAMLHDQTAKTASDLITIEKELAQAQTDIETITAQRDMLQTRADTIRVEISYVGAASLIGGADLTPIYQSIRTLNQTAVNSASWLISFLAAIVPWLPVIALVWWGARRAMRRWKSRKPAG